MLDLNSFFHSSDLQIRYNDIDMAGHVNNAIHMYYYDYGKLKYFNNVFADLIKWREKGFVVVKTTIEYNHPIYLEDSIKVYNKITKIGNKSIEMFQAIYNQNNIINSFNTSVMVGFNYITQESLVISDEWKDKIRAFEKL